MMEEPALVPVELEWDGELSIEDALARLAGVDPLQRVVVRVGGGEVTWRVVPAGDLRRLCSRAQTAGMTHLRELDLRNYGIAVDELREPRSGATAGHRLILEAGRPAWLVVPRSTRSTGSDEAFEALRRPAVPFVSLDVHGDLLVDRVRPPMPPPTAGEEPLLTEADVPSRRPEGDALHWNTTFPGNEMVRRSRVLPAGFPCALRTSLGPTADPDSLTAGAADLSGLAQEKEPVDVQFRVEVEGAGVRRPNSGADFAASVWSDRLSCVPGEGTPMFDVEIQANTPGEIKIALLLFVRGAEIATADIQLRAVESAPVAAAHGSLSHAGLRRTRTASAWLMFRADGAECTVEARVGQNQSENPEKVATHKSDLEALISRHRKALVQMSARYEPEGEGFGLAGGKAFVEELARLGRELHRALFGRSGDSPSLRAIGEQIARLGHPAPGAAGHSRAPRLRIDAQLLAIPWGIVHDAPAGSPPDPAGFWGYRFQIDRILRLPLTGRSDSTVDISLSPRTSLRPVINEGLDAEQNVSVVEAQRSFFAERGASPPVVQRAGLEALLKGEEASKLLYFFCHGVAAETSAFHKKMSTEEAKLAVDKSPISAHEMLDLRDRALPGSPLVFLNACSTTQGDSAYPSVFVETFLKDWAARGVIGADWKLPTVFADRFARSVLSRLLAGDELGDAFHAVTVQAMQANNPFGLIYALYAPPEITVTLPPENKP